MNTISPRSYDLSSASAKRKRGRPKKDKLSGSESYRNALGSSSTHAELVGKDVSGSFVGVFDAGYLLTVQVGTSGPILTGLVFDPRLSVPISEENDIAPYLPMLRRDDFSPPMEEGSINRGVASSRANTELKNIRQLDPGHSSHIPQTASDTPGPAKASNINLEKDCTPISAGVADVPKPSNDCNPSVASMTASLEASKDSPADISKETPPNAFNETPHTSSDPWNIPKVEGLPFKTVPCAAFKPSKASMAAPKVQPDEPASREPDFDLIQALHNRSVESLVIDGESVFSPKSLEPSQQVNAKNSPTDSNVSERLEDGPTVPEASPFQA